MDGWLRWMKDAWWRDGWTQDRGWRMERWMEEGWRMMDGKMDGAIHRCNYHRVWKKMENTGRNTKERCTGMKSTQKESNAGGWTGKCKHGSLTQYIEEANKHVASSGEMSRGRGYRRVLHIRGFGKDRTINTSLKGNQIGEKKCYSGSASDALLPFFCCFRFHASDIHWKNNQNKKPWKPRWMSLPLFLH